MENRNNELKEPLKYRTINGEVISLNSSSEVEKRFIRHMITLYLKKPYWDKFANYWLNRIGKVYNGKSRKDIAETVSFKICQDLESRLGILHDKTRMSDYRDQLSEIVDVRYGSRYYFCRKFHVDEGYLSNVLNKKRHISINSLSRILNKAGYELDIREKTKEKQLCEIALK